MIYNAYSEQLEEIQGIKLVSAGHIFAKSGREINRPNGRDDWLLFYIAKECETFYLKNTQIAEAGSFIIYAPGEKQHHMFSGSGTAEFYYIHFKCTVLPNQLETSKIYNLQFKRQFCDIFEDVISQILQKHPFYEKLCIYNLLYLLTLLERDVFYTNNPDKENFERIARVIHHMNKHYNSNFSLDDYASMCNISKYHFIRVFEKIVGNTPLEYRNNIRLEHAVDLLTDTNLSIEEISGMLGYSSASYFSSAFKKKYNLSPKQYQMKT